MEETHERIQLNQESDFPTDPSTFVKFSMDQEFGKSLIGCFYCKKVLDPVAYFICEKNGHHNCEKCASVDRSDSVAFSSLPKPVDVWDEVKVCCAANNLVKGPPRLMELLQQSSKWECQYKYQGCKEMVLGSDWESHAQICNFKKLYLCKRWDCNDGFMTKQLALKHYTDLHKMNPHNGDATNLTVTNLAIRRGCAAELIEWNNGYYIFNTEISGAHLYGWVWDMQTIDDERAGTQDLSANVKYKISLIPHVTEDENSTTAPEVFHARCVPYHFGSEEVFSSGGCISIPFEMFSRVYLSAWGPKAPPPFCVFKLEMGKAGE